MADAPFGKLKNILPSLVQKKDDAELEDLPEDEDNSRGETINKKQHDVLLQLNIPAQTQLDAKILTPTKVKKVGFHVTDEGGYSFAEVEEFHAQVVNTVGWFADKLFERDSDVRKLATEVDKYITDFQNMKLDIELLENAAASNAVNQDVSLIDDLENRNTALERENSKLRSQNELLKAQIKELQQSATQEESQVPNTSGGLSNAERQHLEQLEAWAAEVQVLYAEMEEALEAAQNDNATLIERVGALEAQLAESTVSDEIMEQIAQLTQKIEESDAAYAELSARYSELDDFATKAEEYGKEMEAYAQTIADELERLQQEQQSTPEEPEAEQAPAPTPIEKKPAYRLPEGVSLDDL